MNLAVPFVYEEVGFCLAQDTSIPSLPEESDSSPSSFVKEEKKGNPKVDKPLSECSNSVEPQSSADTASKSPAKESSGGKGAFVAILARLISDDPSELVRWSSNGRYVIVSDGPRFATLLNTYKHGESDKNTTWDSHKRNFTYYKVSLLF
jgi:hypothetical protein